MGNLFPFPRPPRRSTANLTRKKAKTNNINPNMIAIKRATLCLCLLSPLVGGMAKRTLFQGIDPVADIEQGLQGVGQDLLNMFDGGTMIVQEGGLDTIDTTLLDELEQEPDATVSGLTVAVGSEPSGQMVFKPEQLDIKSGDTVTWLNVDGLEHNIVFSRVPDGVDKSALDHTELFSDGSVSSTFDPPGTYMYFSAPRLCQGMVGRIIVT